MPVGLRQIVDLMGGDIHAPGGNFVKLRLPHVRALSLDQRDVELSLASVFVAQARRKLQSAGSATDDHDAGCSQLWLTHDGLDQFTARPSAFPIKLAPKRRQRPLPQPCSRCAAPWRMA